AVSLTIGSNANENTSAHPFPAPEDALGPYQQDQDQHDERWDVLELGRHSELRAHLDEQSDEEPADQRAVGRAEAAERDAGEHDEDQVAAGLRADTAVGRERTEQSAHRRQRSADEPRDADHLLAVDAGRGGELGVV